MPIPATPSLPSLPSPVRVPVETIFPQQHYRHRLKLLRGDACGFFRHQDAPDRLEQRAYWIRSNPNRYAPVLPEAMPLVAELREMTAAWGLTTAADCLASADHSDSWRQLAAHLEPDIVLLSRDSGRIRMVAGAVCWPSSWAPESKLGLPIEEIHSIVPGLNREIGPAIDTFLNRIEPGPAWLRANWGLSASPELNQHPARGLPRLSSPLNSAQVWLRIEQQALVALPKTHGLLFGIRIEQMRLSELGSIPEIALGLRFALETMPAEMARYKGLAEALPELIAMLPGRA